MRNDATLMAGGELADHLTRPFAARAASVTPHDSRLDSRFVDELPRRLVGSRAYEADPLDSALADLGVERIAARRRKEKRPGAIVALARVADDGEDGSVCLGLGDGDAWRTSAEWVWRRVAAARPARRAGDALLAR
jgi:hypothetical protein